MGASLFTKGTAWADYPATTTPVTAARLQAHEDALGLLGGGKIKLVANTSQSSTADQAGIRVALQVAEIDTGGADLTATTGASPLITVNTTGLYRVRGYVPFSSAARAGDRGLAIAITTGTPNMASDLWIANAETAFTGTNGALTGAWDCENELSIAAGTKVYLQAYQHARAGSGTATIGMGENGAYGAYAYPYLLVQRVG